MSDWIARRLNIVNAGEVWQTFRSVGAVHEPNFDDGAGRWARAADRASKNAEIEAHPFWSGVLARAKCDPYAALVSVAREHAGALVDCSKTDQGIARYKAQGCHVVVVHTVRAFSTWSRSVKLYRARYGLPFHSTTRLLSGYVRINRKLREHRDHGPYYLVPLEQLGQLETLLDFTEAAAATDGKYLRCEMFGTSDFTAKYDSNKATKRITLTDRFLYALIRFSAL